MIDHLFGSKTRVALLTLFYENPDTAYFVRQLTREIKAQINSVRRELDNLSKMGIVRVVDNPPEEEVPAWEESGKPYLGRKRKKYFQLNSSFILHEELSSLFAKSHLMVEKDMMSKLRELPNAKLLVMTGSFTGVGDLKTDILIVGKVSKDAISQVIKQFEFKLGREINYSMMSIKEYQYRKEITDKFLYDILVNPKIIVIDEIGAEDDAEVAKQN